MRSPRQLHELVLIFAALHFLSTNAQVVNNGDFSSDLSSWETSGTAGHDEDHVRLTHRESSIQQFLSGFTVGTSYRLRFLASATQANRFERVKVQIDGVSHTRQLPANFIPVDLYFVASASSVSLEISNWSPANSEIKVVLVDSISVEAADPPPRSPLDNPSFEADLLTPDQSYLYTTPDAWDATGTVLVRNTIPDAFPTPNWGGLSSGVGEFHVGLQTNSSSLGGTLYDLTPGKVYRVQFLAAGRKNSPGGKDNQVLTVSVDGLRIFSKALSWKSFRLHSAVFEATAPTAYLLFDNDSGSGDKTVFLDAVSLYDGDPEPSLLANPSFEEDNLNEIFNTPTNQRPSEWGTVAEHYAYLPPTGWNRTGGTVIAYNKNSDWGLNPSWGSVDSKAGRQFCVLQRQGASVSQTVSGLLPGRSYKLSFLAARRPGSLGNDAKLEIKAGGEPITKSWVPQTAFTYYEAEFVPSSTSEEITFENMSPPGDRSVFIDAVSVVRPAVCTSGHDYEFQGGCWKVLFDESSDGMYHPQAEAVCQEWGGELATIATAEENEKLLQRGLSIGWGPSGKDQGMWIGAQRKDQTMDETPDSDPFAQDFYTFVWPDGSEILKTGSADTDPWSGYANWGDWAENKPEPNNWENRGEHCTAMRRDGKWNDAVCEDSGTGAKKKHAAACRKPATICDVVSSGFCYIVRDDVQTRSDADAVCTAWGGTLATIPDSTAEAKLAVFLASSAAPLSAPAWVGAQRLQPGAAWKWDDDTTVTYLNFQTGEPARDAACAIVNPAGAALSGSPCQTVTSPYVCSRRLMAPCSGTETRTASSGTFGDSHSHPDQLCTWVIEPAVQASSIAIVFNRLDIEKGFDFIRVRDSSDTLVATFTGTSFHLDELVVPGHKATVEFETDWAVQNEPGFEASYVATTMTCLDDPCDSKSTCSQKQDSTFQCTCNLGFMGDGDLSKGGPGCGDVNECQFGSTLEYPCSTNAVCTNTVGSAVCACESGYEGDPYAANDDACTNVDECSVDNPCDVNAVCSDLEGSYTCACRSGFQGTGIGENSCTDIDECAATPSVCDEHAQCINHVGVPYYECVCDAGWVGTGEPGQCNDVDECAPLNQNNCDNTHGVCTNSDGSYSCSCEEGWTTADNFDPAQPYGSGATCYDADECTFSTDNCDVDAVCTNTDGGFSCICPAGFVGDGLECFALCSEKVAETCHALANCQDKTCICPEGIFGDGVGATGCDREAWAVRFSIRLPWVTAADTTAMGKLVSWETFQPAYIELLTTEDTRPKGFATSMHHEVQVFAVNEPGGLLTISALFASQADADAARARLQSSLGAETPPTVFDVELSGTQTTLAGGARRDLDDDTLLIVGAYPVEPRVYTWVAPTTSAEIRVLPTGLSVDAVYFEPSCKWSGCWVADITYTTGEDNFNVIYIPNTEATPLVDTLSYDFDYNTLHANGDYAMSAQETFTVSNFPCGQDNYDPERADGESIPHKVTACCIPEFVQLYRPLLSFVTEVGSKVTQTTCDQGTLTYFLPASNIDKDPTIAYKAKPSNAVSGPFAGMTYAEVVFTGVLDPYVRQYTATVYFDERELREKAGMLRGTVGVEHTIDTFIGIANFKPTGIAFLDSSAMQVNLHLEKTSFFSVSTHGTNEYTFLEYVNLRLVAVYNEDTTHVEEDPDSTDRTTRTNSSLAAHYVQVTFTMADAPRFQPMETHLVPSSSVLVSKGVFATAAKTLSTRFHACAQYNDGSFAAKSTFDLRFPDSASGSQLCAPDAAMCASPSSVPDGFVSFNIPLGLDWLPAASDQLDSNVFISLVVDAIDTVARDAGGTAPNSGGNPWQMKTTLSASIPVVAGGVNIFCDQVTAKTDLRDVADVDIVFGSASTTDEMSRLRIMQDIASTDLQPTTPPPFETDSIEAGLMTLVVKGNETYFGRTGGAGSYGLEVEDVITVHVMEGDSGTKMAAVKTLLGQDGADNYDSNQNLETEGYALNGAFRFRIERSGNRAHLEPSDLLLDLCPFNPTRPTTADAFPSTCVTRRDIQARDFPHRNGAGKTATEVQPLRDTPLGAVVAADDVARAANGAFMQSILGQNSNGAALGKAFGFALGEWYGLNGQYRRAWWINPGYEWTPTQTGGQPLFTVSQKILLFALLNLNEGFATRRRVLLQSRQDVAGTGASVAALEVRNDMSAVKLMAQTFGVGLDRVATYKVRVTLSSAEVCDSSPDALRAAVRQDLQTALAVAASPLQSVQIVTLAVLPGHGVQCSGRRAPALRRTTLGAAEAETELLVVFAPDSAPQLDTAKLAQASERVVQVDALVVSSSVAPTVSGEPAVTADDSDGGEESSGMPMAAVVGGAVGGVVGLAALAMAGFALMRWRNREVERGQEVHVAPFFDSQSLKAELAGP